MGGMNSPCMVGMYNHGMDCMSSLCMGGKSFRQMLPITLEHTLNDLLNQGINVQNVRRKLCLQGLYCHKTQ